MRLWILEIGGWGIRPVVKAVTYEDASPQLEREILEIVVSLRGRGGVG